MTVYPFGDFVLGIDRNRSLMPPKDGAFYDLVNVDLTPGHTIKRRNGFAKQQALTGAVGLTAFAGSLHTFFSGVDPGSTSLCKTHKLVCPDGSGSSLANVYLAAPLLGYLYVVASFSNGSTWHFYLDEGSTGCPTWTASTNELFGAIVCPTVYNGLRYMSTTIPVASEDWAPKIPLAINDTIRPTKGNGFVYQVTTLTVPAGATAATGTTEPSWPTMVGATVVEDVVDTVTKTKTWGAGLYVAAGEQLLPTKLLGFGLHAIASFNPEGARNVNYTGAFEPNWPTVAGQTVDDGTITWTIVEHVLIKYTCVAGTVTGIGEPIWPSTPGLTVVDNGVTWVALANNIKDKSCPSTPAAVIGASRIFAQGKSTEPDIVPYCSVANPRAWNTTATPFVANTQVNVGDQMVMANGSVQQVTIQGITGAAEPGQGWASIPGYAVQCGTASFVWVGISAPDDAGFIASGLQTQSGDTTVTALGLYRGSLAIFTTTGFQVWQIDTDPTQIILLDQFDGRGCVMTRGIASLGGDAYFTSLQGIRSLSTVAQTVNMDAGDAGVFVDPLVMPLLSAANTFQPLAIYIPDLGRFVLYVGNQAFALNSYPVMGVLGWSRYTLPWNVLYAANMGQHFVLADDGNLYKLSDAQWQDDTSGLESVYTSTIEWPYMVLGRHTMFTPMGTAGYMKMMRGVAMTANAQATLTCGYSDGDAGAATPPQTIGPDDRVAGIQPIELLCTSLSPQITYATNFPFELSGFAAYYDLLAQMVA